MAPGWNVVAITPRIIPGTPHHSKSLSLEAPIRTPSPSITYAPLSPSVSSPSLPASSSPPLISSPSLPASSSPPLTHSPYTSRLLEDSPRPSQSSPSGTHTSTSSPQPSADIPPSHFPYTSPIPENGGARPSTPPSRSSLSPVPHTRAASYGYEDGVSSNRDPTPKPVRVKKASKKVVPYSSRPDGEVGRPGRGGFSLRVALGWDIKKYKAAKTSINSIVDEYLKYDRVFTEQETVALDKASKKILTIFPHLANYQGQWPVRDFIFTRHQYRRTRYLLSQKLA